MSVIYVLLVAHFVGDFICQSDWMAVNKSQRWDALALHVAVYTTVLFFAAGAIASLPNVSDELPVLWLAVNAAAHFVQDAITSRINARLWFIDGVRIKPDLRDGTYAGSGLGRMEVAYNNKRHWFFVGIGADQLLHYITLFVTAGWWLR